MKDISMQRNLYKILHRKCKFIDTNPALKNVFLLPPSHLFSLRAGTIDRIRDNIPVQQDVVIIQSTL